MARLVVAVLLCVAAATTDDESEPEKPKTFAELRSMINALYSGGNPQARGMKPRGASSPGESKAAETPEQTQKRKNALEALRGQKNEPVKLGSLFSSLSDPSRKGPQIREGHVSEATGAAPPSQAPAEAPPAERPINPFLLAMQAKTSTDSDTEKPANPFVLAMKAKGAPNFLNQLKKVDPKEPETAKKHLKIPQNSKQDTYMKELLAAMNRRRMPAQEPAAAAA